MASNTPWGPPTSSWGPPTPPGGPPTRPHLLDGRHHHVLHRLLQRHDALDVLCKEGGNADRVTGVFRGGGESPPQALAPTFPPLAAHGAPQHQSHQFAQLLRVGALGRQHHVGHVLLRHRLAQHLGGGTGGQPRLWGIPPHPKTGVRVPRVPPHSHPANTPGRSAAPSAGCSPAGRERWDPSGPPRCPPHCCGPPKLPPLQPPPPKPALPIKPSFFPPKLPPQTSSPQTPPSKPTPPNPPHPPRGDLRLRHPPQTRHGCVPPTPKCAPHPPPRVPPTFSRQLSSASSRIRPSHVSLNHEASLGGGGGGHKEREGGYPQN